MDKIKKKVKFLRDAVKGAVDEVKETFDGGPKNIARDLGWFLKDYREKNKIDPNPGMGLNSNVSRLEAQDFAEQNPVYQESLKKKNK